MDPRLLHLAGSFPDPRPALVLVPLLVAASTGEPEEGRTLLVSIGTTGALALLGSDSPRISADGRFVAFASAATTLVAGDDNDASDVFVRDLWRGSTTRVSVTSKGAEANGPSSAECISFDGRFVGFTSEATNLVSGDTNGVSDVFVHDCLLGTTERVSLATGGAEGSDRSLGCSISGDGRLVVFASDAADLVSEDSNLSADIFLRDRESGETRRISVDSQGNEADGTSQVPAISRDGRVVTFSSYAGNLAPGDTNLRSDVFVRDLAANRTSRVSVDSKGVQGGGPSWFSSVSSDGNLVAFQSLATNLIPNDGNERDDVFLHDRSTRETTRVSVSSSSSESGGPDVLVTCQPRLSGDGRWVVFHSALDRLVGGDSNDEVDVFLHDRQGGETLRASTSSSGGQGKRMSIDGAVSDDGRFVAFASEASNLLDRGGPQAERKQRQFDVFLRERFDLLGTPYCFGDGSGTDCPCDNAGAVDEGCDNSTTQGGFLGAVGSNQVALDDLVFVAARLPAGRSATLVVADSANQNGVPFHDGLLCIGEPAKRLGIGQTDPEGTITFGPGLAATGGWIPGDVRRFQLWYDDPGGPCNTGENQTNAFEIAFVP